MGSAPQSAPDFAHFLGRVKCFVRDFSGVISVWNEGATALYGWTAQEAIGQSCHALLQTRFPKPLSQLTEELLATGAWQGELHQRCRDRRELVVLSNWALHRDANGLATSVTETNYDLTELSHNQTDLKSTQEESNHRLLELEVLYRTAPVGLCFFDQELRYVRLNEAFAEMDALSIEAHLGRHASEIVPGVAHTVVPYMAQVLTSREPLLEVEIHGATPGDPSRERTWMANFYPVTNGRTFGVSVAFQDITALKAAQETHVRLGAIVESSEDAIISKTLDGVITTWNRSAERIFGYKAEEVIRKPISILEAPHRGDELSKILERLQRNERVEQYETVRRRKDGRYIDVSLTVSPLHDKDTCLVGASEIVRDITEKKRAQAALLRSNEELKQFAFAAAHDLQEPLRNVRLCAQSLDAQYKEKFDEEADEQLTIMAESARRMQALIKDLLAYTEAVDIQGKPEQPIDCNKICRAVLDNLATAIAECDAEVRCARLVPVRAEPTHILQLFQNLISNALKYRAKERLPKIYISAEQRDGQSIFSFEDNGIGIAPEYHDRIFGVFKRLHGRDIPGTGIGLAICKRIVDYYGGRLWLESEVGRGSTFYFSLPVANDFGLNEFTATT